MSTTPPPPPGAPPPPPGGAPPPPVGGGVPPGVPYGGPSTSALGSGQIIALIGAAVVLVSSWLNWFDIKGFDDKGSAHLVPGGILLDNAIEDDAGLSVGALLFVAVALIVLGAFLANVRWLSIVGGAGAVLIAILYLYQVNDLVDREGGGDFSLFDFATYMPLLTIVGGGVAVVGGIIGLQRR